MTRFLAALLGTTILATGSAWADHDYVEKPSRPIPTQVAQIGLPAGQAQLFPQIGAAAYSGPGDVKSGAYAWWSVVRGYSASYASPGTNPAFDYSCTGGSPSTGTINVLTSGATDTATLNTACGANTVSYTKLYDESGNSRHVVQATAANQPTRVKNCANSTLDCASSSNGQSMATSGFFTQATPLTLLGVFEQSGASGGFTSTYIGPGPALETVNTNNLRFVGGSSGAFDITMSDSSFHTVIGCVDSGDNCNSDGTHTATVTIDCTTTANTAAGGIPGQSLLWGSATSTTIRLVEGGWWASAFSSTDVTNMSHNMRLYYGTAGSC